MNAAAHVVDFPATLGNYTAVATGVARFAREGGVRPAQISPVQYEVLTNYEAATGSVPTRAIIEQTLGVSSATAAGAPTVIRMSGMAHRDVAALPANVQGIALPLMESYVQSNLGAGATPAIISTGVQNLSREDRGILVSMAQFYAEHPAQTAPTGDQLLAQTAMVRTIMDSTGLKDASRALPYIGAVEAYARERIATRQTAAGTPILATAVPHGDVALEIDQIPMQVVRACMVTQDQHSQARCANLQFIDLVAQTTRGNNLGASETSYQTAQMYLNPAVLPPNTVPTGAAGSTILGSATANAVFNSPAAAAPGGHTWRDFYRHIDPASGTPTPVPWTQDSLIEVQQQFQNAGAAQYMSIPGVAQQVREVYQYNPELVPQYILALTSVGQEHANLGSAILINHLQQRYGWRPQDMTLPRLSLAEHLRVRGTEPTMDAIHNTNPTTLPQTGVVNEPQVINQSGNFVQARGIDMWT
jgi:hypothetical protein